MGDMGLFQLFRGTRGEVTVILLICMLGQREAIDLNDEAGCPRGSEICKCPERLIDVQAPRRMHQNVSEYLTKEAVATEQNR